MKILVVDDEAPGRGELVYEIRETIPEAEIDEAQNGEEALNLADRKKYDIAFVDVQLGDVKGTVLARTLKQLNPEIQIIMATAYEQYAVEAFEIDVTDYLLKPFAPERVAKALSRAQEHMREPKNGQEKEAHKISLMTENKTLVMSIQKIIYIETDQRNCIVHTKKGSYKVSQSIGNFDQRLSERGFFRCHKSFLINLNYVTEIVTSFHNAMSVKMEGMGDLELPVSRSKVKELKNLYSL